MTILNFMKLKMKLKETKEIIKFKNFKPLTEFMSINEYHKIISSCSIVIMNHIRQQALGNIISMMYFGAKVFLNKKNPIYSFFLSQGAVIFSIDMINDESISRKLTKKEIEINRNILNQYWSREVMLEKTKKLINIVRE